MNAAQPEMGALLHAASRRLITLGDRTLKPLGVTSAQWKVLAVLARRGPSRVSDLVDLLEHDQASVSRLVARMVRDGLISRREDPADARAELLRLTARGRETHARCEETLTGVMHGLLRSFPVSEREALARLLARFVVAIDGALGSAEPASALPRRRPGQGKRTRHLRASRPSPAG